MAQGPDVGTPEWWLPRMLERLLTRQADMEKYDEYYRGDHPLPFLTKAHGSKMRNEFANLLADSRSNFMALVVDAVEERLSVEGFRLSASSDPISDGESWDTWQANNMDANVQTAFLESMVKGVSYVSVWDDTNEDGYPDMCIEDPLQTIVAYVPGSGYTQRAAALKVWLDDWTGEHRANVYLPDGIYKYSAPGQEWTTTPTPAQMSEIIWTEMPDEFVANPYGIVPIVPLRNRPRLLVEGESELKDVFRIQNQINGFLFLLALAGYFGAHRQRWAVGLTINEDDEGKPKEPFDVAIDKLWQSENPEVKFGEFSQTDLKGYIEAIEQKVLHLAVTTRTPRHYLIQQGQSPSGDAIQSAESGLVKKVERKQRMFGEGLEEAMRLARIISGKTDTPVDSEIVWANAKTHAPGPTTDAIVKQAAARLITKAVALEELGYSQTVIRKILEAADDEFAQIDPAVESSIAKRDVINTSKAGA